MNKAQLLAKRLLEAEQPVDPRRFIMGTHVRSLRELYRDLILAGFHSADPWGSEEEDDDLPQEPNILLKDVDLGHISGTHGGVLSVEPHQSSDGKIVVDITLRDIEGRPYEPSWSFTLPAGVMQFIQELEQRIAQCDSWYDLQHLNRVIKE